MIFSWKQYHWESTMASGGMITRSLQGSIHRIFFWGVFFCRHALGGSSVRVLGGAVTVITWRYMNHSSRGYISIYGSCSHYTHLQPQFHPKSTAMAPTSSRHWSKWTPAQRSQHQIGRCRRCWCVGRPKWCKHRWRNHRLKSFRRKWDMFEGKNL